MKTDLLLGLAICLPTIFCPAQDRRSAVEPTPAQASANIAPLRSEHPGGATSDTYMIGPGDVITVTVWKEPNFSGTLLVRLDGMISIPLIGDIQASTLTPLQLADSIAAGLKKYVQDPNVTVVISQIHSKVIYILGEVAKKGPIEMTPDMTLLEAISSAGGTTDYANTKRMYVLRSGSGKQTKIPVNYKAALKGDSALNISLRPGDTIVVP